MMCHGICFLADDIVFLSEIKQQVTVMLELWRGTLESNSLKISRTKTKYMEYNFSGFDDSEKNVTQIGNDLVAHCDKFRYLGYMAEFKEGFGLDITNRLRAG